MLQIAVHIGGLDFSPAPVFLHPLEQLNILRLIFLAPFGEQNQRLIVHGFLELSRGLKHRQFQIIVQIFFKCCCAGIGTDIHITDDESNILTDF